MADGTDRTRPDRAATAPAGDTGLPSIDGYPYDVPPELLSMADATVLGMHALLDGAPVALVTHAYRHGEAKLTAAYVQLADVLSDLQAAVGREFTNAPSAAVEAVRRIAVAEAERDRLAAERDRILAAARDATAAPGSPSARPEDEPIREEFRWACRWLDADGNVLDEMGARDNVRETAEKRAHRLARVRPPGAPGGQVVRYRVVTTAEVVATFPNEEGAGS